MNSGLALTTNVMFYVYLLENQYTESWYIGFTADLRRRLMQHRHREVRTTRMGSWKLIYFEAYCNKADAVGREVFLKSGSGWHLLKKQLRHFLDEGRPVYNAEGSG